MRSLLLERFSPTTRAMVALLVVHAFVLPLLLHAAFGTPRAATIVGDGDQFVARSQAGDSWRPMAAARTYAREHPGKDIYAEIFFRERVKFQYAPTSLLFVGSLSDTALNWMSWLAVWVTAALTVGLLLAAMRRTSTPAAAPRGAADRMLAAVAAAGLALTFHPLMKGYALGQIQVWVDALFAAAVCGWYGGWAFTSGVCLGLACLIKPPLAPLVLWMIVRRERRMLAGLIAAGAAGLALSVYLYGLPSHLSYVRVLAFISPRGETYYPNQSINGLLNRWLANGSNVTFDDHAFSPANPMVSIGSFVTTAALLALCVCAPVIGGRIDRRFDFPVAALTVTMASPIAWEHHYGIVLPLLAVLVPVCVDEAATHRAWMGATLACSFLMIGQYVHAAERLAGTPLNPLQSYVLFGGFLLLAVWYRRLVRSPFARVWPEPAAALNTVEFP